MIILWSTSKPILKLKHSKDWLYVIKDLPNSLNFTLYKSFSYSSFIVESFLRFNSFSPSFQKLLLLLLLSITPTYTTQLLQCLYIYFSLQILKYLFWIRKYSSCNKKTHKIKFWILVDFFLSISISIAPKLKFTI